MSDKTPAQTPPGWDPGPAIGWLLEDGRFAADAGELVRRLGGRLLAGGAPVWRLRLSMRTLHPLTAGITSIWERDSDSTTELESPHGLEGRSGYIGSPLEIINRTGASFRKRLADPLSDTDHTVLHDLKARGGTDYFGIPLKFSSGALAILVLTTDAAGGFSDADIDRFAEVASVLAPIVEVFSLRLVSLAAAEAYLGPRTGRRVLDGRITRGHIEKIDAAILFSDIRDWTGLNNRLGAEDALALANRYFDVIADAVEAHEGEILKFIGDGVLAIFATENDAIDADAVCKRALASARLAVRLARATDLAHDVRFGLGLHFGEVLYGNVGSKARLDFTVLGQAVNMATRIESLCGRFDRPILFSKGFADRLTEPTSLVAREILKGHNETSPILTTSDDPRPVR